MLRKGGRRESSGVGVGVEGEVMKWLLSRNTARQEERVRVSRRIGVRAGIGLLILWHLVELLGDGSQAAGGGGEKGGCL